MAGNPGLDTICNRELPAFISKILLCPEEDTTEITGTDFMKHCLTGLCGCAGVALVAEPMSAETNNDETDWLKGRCGAHSLRETHRDPRPPLAGTAEGRNLR